MNTIIKKKDTFSNKENLIIICNKLNLLHEFKLTDLELSYVEKKWKAEEELIFVNQYFRSVLIIKEKVEKNKSKKLEHIRLLGLKTYELLKKEKKISIINKALNTDELLALIEGFVLSSYSFDKHKTTKTSNLKLSISIVDNKIKQTDIAELQNIVRGVFLTKDLVNEPFSHLTATDLANKIKEISVKSNIKIQVLKKPQILKLKMGGLIAVNKGSIDGPTFSILEWKPNNHKNKKPIVLIGKGIVFDTGGLSLKPTTNSMDMMKVDMGGAGAVIGAMYAIALNKINCHVIALVPATDNRPSGNAYAPGDVITMYDGTKVEVLNTDAEGRMILADALSYSKKYNPELVIDLATLTGSAANTIGHFGIVSMHQNAKRQHSQLKSIGDIYHERLAEMPFWNDYRELIESDIADIKNIGGPIAGAITAGKFLAHFIHSPWIHLDIAGPTYVKKKYGYRGKGATGMGVRLLYHFIKNYN